MERWWQEDPARNIGVRVADDETFVDIDTQAAHDRFRERCPVDTTTSRTPRGGWHLRYSGPAKSRVLIKDGDDRLLEVKSARTNVVGVGPIVNGRTYRRLDQRDQDGLDLRGRSIRRRRTSGRDSASHVTKARSAALDEGRAS